MKIIYPIGLTGSSKTTLGNQFIKDGFNLNVVCMDDIRLMLTGDISDQSRNDEVWQLSQNKIDRLLQQNQNIYYSATNLGLSRLLKTINELKEKFCTLEAYLIYMMISDYDNICRKRVELDLQHNIKRSDTVSNPEIIAKQKQKWLSMRNEHQKYINELLYPEYIHTFDYDEHNYCELMSFINNQ